MSAVSTRTKKAWEDYQRKHSSNMMKILVKLVDDGKVRVVSHNLYPTDGGATFTLELDGDDVWHKPKRNS